MKLRRKIAFGTVLLSGATVAGWSSSAAAQPLLQSIRKPAEAQAAPVVPGYLGVVTGEAAGASGGIIVAEVVPAGPADRAGLQSGDVIISIEGRDIKTADDLGQVLSPIGAGGRAAFNVMRGEAKKEVVVTLGDRPGKDARRFEDFGRIPLPEEMPTPSEPRGSAPSAGTPHIHTPLQAAPGGAPLVDTQRRAVIGVRAQPVTPEVRRRTGTPNSAGAWIVGRIGNGPASKAGLPLDCVVVSIDGRAVNSPDDLLNVVASSTPSKPVDVVYYLQGKPEKVVVTLGESSMNPAPVAIAAPSTGGRQPLRERIAAKLPGLIEGLNNGGPNSPLNNILNGGLGGGGDRATVEALQQRVQELEQRLKQLEESGPLPRAEAPRNDAPRANGTEPPQPPKAQPPQAEPPRSIVTPPPPLP